MSYNSPGVLSLAHLHIFSVRLPGLGRYGPACFFLDLPLINSFLRNFTGYANVLERMPTFLSADDAYSEWESPRSRSTERSLFKVNSWYRPRNAFPQGSFNLIFELQDC